MTDKGVSWNVGKVFFREQEVWRFDLLPEPGHRRPAFINLQQYYAEGFLYEQARAEPNIDLRWKTRSPAWNRTPTAWLSASRRPEGPYTLRADWLIACDGARSPVRKLIGQESHGRIFRDRFLIADVKMKADFPAERWFWFDPPFHPNQSVLLHMQPDNVWRIDFQLGWNADPVEAVKPENVLPRIRAPCSGPTPSSTWNGSASTPSPASAWTRSAMVAWSSPATRRTASRPSARAAPTAACRTPRTWPGNSLVTDGLAPETLIDTYSAEREHAADENILNSSRATDFITPKSEISRSFRNAVLNPAKTHPFARSLVNSGRLSPPATYADSPLNTPDTAAFSGRMRPGAVALDAPVRRRRAGLVAVAAGRRFRAGAVLPRSIARRRHAARAGRAAPGAGAGQDRAGRRPGLRRRRRAGRHHGGERRRRPAGSPL